MQCTQVKSEAGSQSVYGILLTSSAPLDLLC